MKEHGTAPLDGGVLDRALAEIDRIHRTDPVSIDAGEERVARELDYARRATAWLCRLVAEPSDALHIAVRAQHLARWELPRSSYPMDRPGYHRWRTELQKRHAVRASEIALAAGFTPEVADRVRRLIEKRNLKTDPDAQALEDAACLTFLEGEFAEFAAKHSDEKVIEILQKTWAKMSPAAHALALTIPMDERSRRLVTAALA
jgi:hypothetical protein